MRSARGSWLRWEMSNSIAGHFLSDVGGFLGARIDELRSRTRGRLGDAAAGNSVGLGVDVERDVQDLVNEFGRALFAEALQMADTSAPEVVVNGVSWGNRRTTRGGYESVFSMGPRPDRAGWGWCLVKAVTN